MQQMSVAMLSVRPAEGCVHVLKDTGQVSVD